MDRPLRAYFDAGLECVTRRFYKGARHELFNEKNRDEVTSDLLDWLETVIQYQTAAGHLFPLILMTRGSIKGFQAWPRAIKSSICWVQTLVRTTFPAVARQGVAALHPFP